MSCRFVEANIALAIIALVGCGGTRSGTHAGAGADAATKDSAAHADHDAGPPLEDGGNTPDAASKDAASRGGSGPEEAGAGSVAPKPVRDAGLAIDGGTPADGSSDAAAIDDDCSVDNGHCGDPTYIRCEPLAPTGRTCVDIDECSTENGGCDPRTTCTNEQGAPPTCSACPFGFRGTGATGCEPVDACTVDNGGCGDPSYVRCTFGTTRPVCEDIRECATGNGGCGDAARVFCIEQFATPQVCQANECASPNGLDCGDPEESRCSDVANGPPRCRAKVQAIAPTSVLTCVLRVDHTIDCWDRNQRVEPFVGSDFVQIDAENTLTCALTASGRIRCTEGPTEALRNVPSSSDFVKVQVGVGHVCGLHRDGTAMCWGDDWGQGALRGSVSSPNAEPGPLLDIAVGYYSTCVLRNSGSFQCWGEAPFGYALESANADGGSDFVAIYAGFDDVCAKHADGRVTCWGHTFVGERDLDNGATDFADVSVGDLVICGLRSDDSAECWGQNEYDQVRGPNAAGFDVAQVRTNDVSTCHVYTDGTVRCFGLLSEGPNDDPWAYR